MNRIPPPATTPSFEESAKPLLLTLKPSRLWLAFLITLHGLATVAILIATIPLTIQLLLIFGILLSFGFHLKRYNATTQLVWRNGNRWFINDQPEALELVAINFFSRWLVILSLQVSDTPPSGNTPNAFTNWLTKWRTQKFTIPFDAVDQDTFRLLRVRLRVEGFELLNPLEDDIR